MVGTPSETPQPPTHARPRTDVDTDPSAAATATRPAPGWYPDPAQPGATEALRYWDGGNWTEHVHPTDIPSPSPWSDQSYVPERVAILQDHDPGARRPVRKPRARRWIAAAVALCAVTVGSILLLARHTAAARFDVHGRIDVTGTVYTWDEASAGGVIGIVAVGSHKCMLTGPGWQEVASGAPIRLYIGGGNAAKQVAAKIGGGTLINGECRFTFTFHGVPPSSNGYTIKVPGQGGIWFSQAEIQRGPRLSLNFG